MSVIIELIGPLSIMKILSLLYIHYKPTLFSKHCNYLRNSTVPAPSSKNCWSLLSKLLHKNLPPPTSFSAQEYHDYIVNKVELIRSNTSLISKLIMILL